MNLERGVKRITLVASVVVGLGVSFYSSKALYDHWYWEREQYLVYRGKYENIRLFWELWDANGWDFSEFSKREILCALVESPWYEMRFTTNTTKFTLSGREVVPGMDVATLSLPSATFAEAVQKAREEGLTKALWPWIEAETFGTKRTRPQLVTLSIMFGLPIGTGAFIVVWLLLFLFKWISRGFCADLPKADKISPGTVTRIVAEVVDEHDPRPLTQEGVPVRAK